MSVRALLAVAALCPLIGCDGCGRKPDAASGHPPPAADSKPAATEPAVLEGVVRLAEGFELPSYPPERMEKKVLDHTEHAPLPDSCAPPKTTDRQPVQLTADGALTNVVVAASDFKKQPQRPPIVHDVLIDDCRLKPAVVVAMVGDTLRVRNALDYPFMPTYGATPVVRTLIKGQTYEVKLDKPGVSPLLCGFTAPCGRTDVVVMLHPVHAATDAQGKFRIANLPAGEQLTISAWHPLFQESTLRVRAEPGEVKRIELVLTPNAPAAAGQGEAAPQGDATPKVAAPSQPAAAPKPAPQ